jgi:hypothetical protein
VTRRKKLWWYVAPMYPDPHKMEIRGIEVEAYYQGIRAIQLGFVYQSRPAARDNGGPDQWWLELDLLLFTVTLTGPEHYDEDDL